MDFTDDNIAELLMDSDELIFIEDRLINYLQLALEIQVNIYQEDLISYFKLLIFFVWLKASGFALIFILMLIFVFLSLVQRLKREIWLNKGILNIIPGFILKNNLIIKEYVWKQKAII